MKVEALANFITRYRISALICLLLSLVFPLCYIGQLKIDNSIEVWLDQESSTFNDYQRFLDRYGSEEYVVVAVKSEKDALSEESLTVQQEVARKLDKIAGVQKVFDLPSLTNALWGRAPGWKSEVRESKALNNLLLGTDAGTWGMIVWFERSTVTNSRKHIIDSIRSVLSKTLPNTLQFYLAGTPLMNTALDSGSEKESKRLMPIALVLAVIVLALMFHSFAVVAAAITAVSATVLWTLGIMGMLGYSINMVSATLPSLLFILSLSTAIHLVSRYINNASSHSKSNETVRTTLIDLIPAISISSLTTAAGFASLSVATMKPVADFGIFAAVGLMVGLVCNLIVVPGMLSLLYRPSKRTVDQQQSWYCRLGVTAAHYPLLVVGLSLLSFAACGYFASSINVESNVLKFFAEDSTLRRDYSFVADNLTGLYTVELDIESDALDEDDVSEALESLGKLIAARPDVARVDYLDRYTQATALSSTDDISQGTKDFFEFVQSKFRYEGEQSVWLRASVYVRTIGSGKFYSLLEFIKEKAEATLPEETTFKITGVVPLLNAVQKDLVTTQITSFSLALIVVLIMIGVFTASLKAAVAAVLPNVLPVALMFAFMGVLGVPLDAATVMIASVAIGIAADDTIHFLIHFRREMLNKCDSNKAVADTLSSVGKPVLLTSIVAAVGFGILVLAEFQPIVYFGLLTSITMLSAFFGDVFILPACVKMVGLWKTN